MEGWKENQLQSYERHTKTTQKQCLLCRQRKCLFVCDTDMHAQSDERLEGCLQKPEACYLISTSAVCLWAVDASLPLYVLQLELKTQAVVPMLNWSLFPIWIILLFIKIQPQLELD